MLKVLFVCSANIDRSKTAEDFFSEQFDNIDFRSAGTHHSICHEKGTKPLKQVDIDDADLILVMENKHRDWIFSNLEVKGKRIEVLGVEDVYTYYSMKLIELLQTKCSAYIN